MENYKGWTYDLSDLSVTFEDNSSALELDLTLYQPIDNWKLIARTRPLSVRHSVIMVITFYS